MTSVPQTSTARIDEDEEGPSLNQVCLDSDIKESNALLDDKDAVIKDLEEKLKQKMVGIASGFCLFRTGFHPL
jgi:hypothetical protein